MSKSEKETAYSQNLVAIPHHDMDIGYIIQFYILSIRIRFSQVTLDVCNNAFDK